MANRKILPQHRDPLIREQKFIYRSNVALSISEIQWPCDAGFVTHTILLPKHEGYDAIILGAHGIRPSKDESGDRGTVHIHLLVNGKHHLAIAELWNLGKGRGGAVKDSNGTALGDAFSWKTYLAWFNTLGIDANPAKLKLDAFALVLLVEHATSGSKIEASSQIQALSLRQVETVHIPADLKLPGSLLLAHSESIGVLSNPYRGWFEMLPSGLQLATFSIWIGGLLAICSDMPRARRDS